MKKRLLCMLLASTMVFATGTTVYAAETGVEASVENANETTDTDDAAVNEAAGTLTDDEALVGATEGSGTIDLNTISMSTNVAQPGTDITITFKAANVKRLHFYYDYVKTDGTNGSFQTKSGEYDAKNGNTSKFDEATGTWTITMRIPADAAQGVWTLDDIQMIDPEGKASYVWNTSNGYKNETSADLSRYAITIGEGSAVPAAPAADLYIYSLDNNGCTIGMTTNIADSKEYRWLYYDTAAGTWGVAQDWTADNEWLNWKPEKYGDYVIQGEVRSTADNSKSATQSTSISYHPNIKGKCQMPYEGGGYLIGVESYDNPDNNYSYELLVLDCTKLASGDPNPWIYTSGQQKVSGNAFWTVWQPQYGYYWTLFRVYDANGNMIDQDCYSFQNAY